MSHPFSLSDEFEIRDVETLRSLFGGTSDVIWDKAAPHLSSPMLRFVELSPFCCISSFDAQGNTDLSPRGDAPGFVQAIGRHTLLLPDRPGNRRYDTFRNVFETGRVSLLFLIPGILDTLRVNGRARVTYEPSVVERFPVRGRVPEMALVITVEEAYGHCSKALRRSKLWSGPHTTPVEGVPTLAEMMTDHLRMDDEMQEAIERVVEMDARHNQY